MTDRRFKLAARLHGLLLSAALALAGAAVAAECPGSGLGGTGMHGGGPDDGSGFGGTGVQTCAGTPFGVAGVITGFGSIFVGGQEIHYDAATPVRTPDGPGSPDALRLGQTVTAQAQARDGRIEAREIALAPVLIGPVSATGEGGLRALGQLVRRTASTRIAGTADNTITRGDWVAVYGLRAADGSVVATRIVRRAPRANALLEGPLERGPAGAWQIAEQKIRPAHAVNGELAPGTFALVEGPLGTDGVLDAQHVAPSAAAALLEMLGGAATVVLEGFVEETGPRALRLLGRALPLHEHTLQVGPRPRPGAYARVTVEGLGNGGGVRLIETDAASVWPGLPEAPRQSSPVPDGPPDPHDALPPERLIEPPSRRPDFGGIEPPRLPTPDWRLPRRF